MTSKIMKNFDEDLFKTPKNKGIRVISPKLYKINKNNNNNVNNVNNDEIPELNLDSFNYEKNITYNVNKNTPKIKKIY